MEETVFINYDTNINGTLLQNSGYHFYPTWEILCTGFEGEEASVVSFPQGESCGEIEISQQTLQNVGVTGKRSKKKTDSSVTQRAKTSGKNFKGRTCGKCEGRNKKFPEKEKELGPDCGCPSKCYEKIGEETIRKIFHDFWALADYNSQNAYLFGLINLIAVKRRYTKKETSRRNFTITYCVKKKGQNVTVCKKAFLNIHGLQRNRGRVNNLTNKMKEGESVPPPDRRGRHANRPNAYSEEAVEHVRRHLSLCPKVERKKSGSKASRQGGLSTKRCYDMYVSDYCKENGLIPVSLDKFRRIFSVEGYRSKGKGFHKTGK